MSPVRNARNYRRVSQACSNCRRKKTRCPGEKPSCSHCVRLRQKCQYSANHSNRSSDGHAMGRSGCDLENRLAQLENRFDMMLERPLAPCRQETPESRDANSVIHDIPPSTPYSSLLPSKDVIGQAIDVYFFCAHRQPLWLFNQNESLSSNSCEELLLTVLGLAIQYAPSRFSDENLRAPEAYNDAARTLIMLRIANASIDISVLQALCLLAYSNLLADQISLVSFHVSLSKALLQSSGIDSQLSRERTVKIEEQRRLFWSVFLLDSICGQHYKVPSFVADIHSPRYVMAEGLLQSTSARCPSLPQESDNDNEDDLIGIWGLMASMASIWPEVRMYVSRCAEDDMIAPWRPESTYTLINSHLLDHECSFPAEYRYDSANFMERSTEEIAAKRQYWLPWMRVQITYHAMHCMLNHPFLYSARTLKLPPGNNAFWKTSSQLALLHSTWIARLLDMANKKGLQLSDPFFAHVAVVAATLHSYWSRAADATIRAPARRHLEICRSFVTGLGSRWPICQSMADSLNEFLHLTLEAEVPRQSTPESNTTNASLMWRILEFAAVQPDAAGKGLFPPSFRNDQQLETNACQDHFTIADPEVNTPATDIYNTAGHHASPPDWFSPVDTRLEGQETRHASGQLRSSQPQQSLGSLLEVGANLPLLSNWAWGPIDTQNFHDPATRYQEQSDLNLGWCDTGNL